LAPLLLLLAAADASAYTTITSPPSRWERGRIPVAWYLNENGSRDLGIDRTETAVQASFDTWQDVDCCYIAFDYRGRSSRTANGGDGSNVVSWSESGWYYGGSAIAVTSDWFGYGTIEEADIDCNGVYMSWDTSGTGGVDTQSILTHEIGHFLGLGDLYDGGHASSTMYGVYSGGTGARSLAEDDKAGCQYLYEETCGSTPDCTTDDDCGSGYHCEGGTCVRNASEGRMCDPCESHEDCADGYCLSGFADGGTYCGENCTSSSDCGSGNECATLSGGIRQCVPSDGDCSGSSSGCTTDADCTPGYHCEGGECVPDAPPPDCTVDSDCPEGLVCRGGECVEPPEPGLRGFGETCAGGEECQSGLCLDDYCTQTCPPWNPIGTASEAAPCPAGYYCDDLGCGPGTGESWTACSGDGDCASAFCAVTGGAGTCMVPCDPAALGGCQYGEICEPRETAACGVCLCGGGMFGDACEADADCVFGRCLAPAGGETRRCTAECASGRCPAGSTCRTVPGEDGGPLSVCFPDGLPLGAPCTADGDCQSGMCGETAGTTYCTRPCGGFCSCPMGTTCNAVGGESRCMPAGLDVGPGLEGGCGCRASGGGWGAGLALLLAAGLVLCRRLLARRRA
jgi:hypothetical protein